MGAVEICERMSEIIAEVTTPDALAWHSKAENYREGTRIRFIVEMVIKGDVPKLRGVEYRVREDV